MITKQVLKIGTKAITQVAQKVYAKPSCELRTLESLGLKMENLCEDVVQIGKKNITSSRFSTPQMKQARQMNRIASQQLKAGAIERTYPKATPQDLKRLISETVENTKSRVIWTNPKDGKVYNILKQGKTKDGKIIVRILDEEGAFIKEAELTPKKIVIIDDFSSGKSVIRDNSTMLETKTHGEIVALLAQRHNPYASIELIDIAYSPSVVKNFYSEIENLQRRIDLGEQIDYISLSLGSTRKNKDMLELLHELNITPTEMKTSEIAFNHPSIFPYPASSLAIRNKGNVRIIQGSANSGKESTNIWLTYPRIEGCGALNPETGKIAGFSSSRNSLYTQHYENGMFKFKPNSGGMSITGKHNVDVQIRAELRQVVSNYLGKSPIKTTAEENKIINTLREQAKEKYASFVEKLKEDYTLVAERMQIAKIKNEIKLAQTNRDRARYDELAKELKSIEEGIMGRIQPMINKFNCEEITAYQNVVRKLKQENKVISGFGGEYYVPSENPLALKPDIAFQLSKEGILELQVPRMDWMGLNGTSYSTPVRTAKLALNDMMEGIL